jgi:hypothetical protein
VLYGALKEEGISRQRISVKLVEELSVAVTKGPQIVRLWEMGEEEDVMRSLAAAVASAASMVWLQVEN